MEHFAKDTTTPLRQFEKECLFSGKSVEDLTTMIEIISHEARPRRHIRNVVAASINTMERINLQFRQTFTVNSITLAQMLLESITPSNSYVCKADRWKLINDLHAFRSLLQAAIKPPASTDSVDLRDIRVFLQPTTAVFDRAGELLCNVDGSLHAAGAKTVALSMTPSADGTADHFTVSVGGVVSEEEFLESFSKLTLNKVPSPTIQYSVLLPGQVKEEKSLQMGDWTGNDTLSLLLANRRPEGYGNIGAGTVGALVTISSLKALTQNSAQSTVNGSVKEVDVPFTLDLNIYGEDDENENENETQEEALYGQNSPRGVVFADSMILTAAHVCFSELQMPAGDFLVEDVKTVLNRMCCIVARRNEENVEQSVAEIQLAENIERINEFNRNTAVCALYTPEFDIALMHLAPVQTIAPTKLHVAKSINSSWSSWTPKFMAEDTLVVKVGAKTGFTIGKYVGIQNVKDFQGSNPVGYYKDCVAVKHIVDRFCKGGDSGSIYYALLPRDSEEDELAHDPQRNVLEWLPIAIHRTSDRNHSYGSPLAGSIKALSESGKLAKCIDVSILHNVVEPLQPYTSRYAFT